MMLPNWRRNAPGFLLLFISFYLLLLLLLPKQKISLRRTHLQASSSLLELKNSPHDHCRGKRIYVYDLPRELNTGILEKCSGGLVSWLNFCRHLQNSGLGEPIDDSGWFATDAYMLEVIFHSRIQSYRCLTREPARADAFFVPYYAGLDALPYLYSSPGSDHEQQEQQQGRELVAWLARNASESWRRFQGRDHFMVMGRTSWDFAPAPGQWGTGIQSYPHIENMTTLYLERNPWAENQVAIPYPTSFHPSNRTQLEDWISRVRSSPRTSLFAFSGSIRPTMVDTKRGILLSQCRRSSRCVLVDCGRLRCGHDPRPSVSRFIRSVFCLQPRGDTSTRRSAFDAIISGCIPVFFHRDSAYSQYLWHLPGEPSSYSVFISEDSLREDGGVEVEEVLSSYSPEMIDRLRERVISLIPSLIYRVKGGEVEGLPPDAFDVSLVKALERIAELKKIFPE